MEIDSESNVKVSEEAASSSSSMQTDSSNSATAVSGQVKDDISVSMEKLQLDKASSSASAFKKKPVIIIVVGMAGIHPFNTAFFQTLPV